MVTLLTGGVRSGKSLGAMDRALAYPGHRTFIATAEPFDDEMRIRVKRHQEERAGEFITVEVPLNLAEAIKQADRASSVILVDCLTVWLGNLFHYFESDEGKIIGAIDSLCRVLETVESPTILVTNEVGWGIVPEDRLSRDFRDMAGMLNRRVAAVATGVELFCCGISVKIK